MGSPRSSCCGGGRGVLAPYGTVLDMSKSSSVNRRERADNEG